MCGAGKVLMSLVVNACEKYSSSQIFFLPGQLMLPGEWHGLGQGALLRPGDCLLVGKVVAGRRAVGSVSHRGAKLSPRQLLSLCSFFPWTRPSSSPTAAWRVAPEHPFPLPAGCTEHPAKISHTTRKGEVYDAPSDAPSHGEVRRRLGWELRLAERSLRQEQGSS